MNTEFNNTTQFTHLFNQMRQAIINQTDKVPLGLLFTIRGDRNRVYLFKSLSAVCLIQAQFKADTGENLKSPLKIRPECFCLEDDEPPHHIILCDAIEDMCIEERPKWYGNDISVSHLDGTLAPLFDPSVKENTPFTSQLMRLEQILNPRGMKIYGFMVMDKDPYLDTGVKRVWSITHRVCDELYQHALYVVGEPEPIPLIVRGDETALLDPTNCDDVILQSEVEMRILREDVFYGKHQPNINMPIALDTTLKISADEPCCICLGITEPESYVLTSCQHAFCNCILHHITTNGVKCPMCRQPITRLTYNQELAYNKATEFPGITATAV